MAETSTVELTADARLATAGEGMVSERTLRRIRFRMAGVPAGVGLYTGTIFVASLGT